MITIELNRFMIYINVTNKGTKHKYKKTKLLRKAKTWIGGMTFYIIPIYGLYNLYRPFITRVYLTHAMNGVGKNQSCMLVFIINQFV